MKALLMSLVLIQSVSVFAAQNVDMNERVRAAATKVEEIEVAEAEDFTEVSILDSFSDGKGLVFVTSQVSFDTQAETTCWQVEFEGNDNHAFSLTRTKASACR